ncbi:hypothetical protein FEM54_28880, partial [Pseudomonas edaphica]
MCERVCVGAGLPAIQAPRYFSNTRVMQSQASQLPHRAPLPQGVVLISISVFSSRSAAHSTVCRCSPREIALW